MLIIMCKMIWPRGDEVCTKKGPDHSQRAMTSPMASHLIDGPD